MDATAHPHQGPLVGLRVIDLATVFAGPSAARRLADFGATDVVAGFASEGQQMIDSIRRFGEKIISKNRAP